MVRYRNTDDTGNILHLHTKHCIQEDITETKILLKCFLSYWQKDICTKVAINGKISALWSFLNSR